MPDWRRLLLGLWLALALAAGAAAQTLELHAAEFVLDENSAPPGDDAPWHPQSLPDVWRVNHPGAGDYGWYRLRFTLAAVDDPLQAVYLPKLGLNAAAYVNGRPIGDGGSFSEPLGRNWNRPLLFLVPPGLLRPGDNVVHIRLRNHAYTQASLHPVLVGPDKALRPAFERAEFLYVTLNQTATLLITSIGLLMLSLWWRRRQDVAYGYFGLAALIWAAQSTNLYLRQAPLPTAAWEILANGSVQMFSGFLLISLLRYAAAGGGPIVRALWLAVVASPLSLALVPARHFLTLTAFWHFYTLLAAAATLAVLLRAALRFNNRDAGLLVAAMALVLVLAGHDWLMHSQHLWGLRQPGAEEHVYLLHYSAPFVFLAVGLIMTSRFVRVLNQFEALNDELESRVRDKQAELEHGFARMRQLETESAVLAERERIYRDLHDDVGAKLLSLVYRAATPDDADLARSALQDLRDVVSRTGADGFSLEELAADWRAECEQRLSEAGLALDWQQSGQLAEAQLGQPQALNVGRILREAVSNVIHHARAGRVGIALRFADGRLSLAIQDDGCGRTAGRPGGGKGLLNIEARTRHLGGAVAWGPATPAGWVVTLDLPLA